MGSNTSSVASPTPLVGEVPAQAPDKSIIEMANFVQYLSSYGPIVHIKGFGDGMKANWKDIALEQIGTTCRTIAWDGDAPKPDGFTALVERFLQENPSNVAIGFRDAEKLDTFKVKWEKQLEIYGRRIIIVPVDKVAHKVRFGLQSEEQHVSELPDAAREFYFLGRIALKATQAKRVVCVGGGGIGSKEAESSFADGVKWTVLAVSRGRREEHPTIFDWALTQRDNDKVTLIRGIEQSEEDEQMARQATTPEPFYSRIYRSINRVSCCLAR